MYFVVETVRDDLLDAPLPVRKEFGHALYLAQTGATHQNGKRLHGFGSGVLEVVEHQDGDTSRAVHTARFAEAVYVLHVFQKKSTRGIETPQKELGTIQTRLQRAQQQHEEYLRRQEEEQKKHGR